MFIEICDRCKKLPDPTRLPIYILKIEYRPQEKKSLADFLGFEQKTHLCEDCFNDFMRFIR